MQQDIIHGELSGPSDYPSTGVLIGHAVLPQGMATAICTATLIADDVILTAAHCFGGSVAGVRLSYFFSRALDLSNYRSLDFELPTDAISISAPILHPLWRPDNFATTTGQELLDAKDIALGILERPVRNVEPAVVLEDDDRSWIRQNAEVEIVGYGIRVAGDELSAGIKYQALSFINEVGASEMQIGDSSPTPLKCQGDSGGPSFLRVDDGVLPDLRVVGVTSHSYGQTSCGTGSVDTRVDAYRDWIEEQMIEACTDCKRRSCAQSGRLRKPGEPVFPYEPRDLSACEQNSPPALMPPQRDEEGCDCNTTSDSRHRLACLPLLLLMVVRRRSTGRG